MHVTILRTDGREEDHIVPPGDLAAIKRLIDCTAIDTVMLTRDEDGARTVMLVDDDGYEIEVIEHKPPKGMAFMLERRPIRAKKPINAEATKRYHEAFFTLFGKTTDHAIVGDVAIVDDRDFR